MIELINDGFIDEERFSRSFCRGKFRIKKWGRRKIKSELKNEKYFVSLHQKRNGRN